MQRRKISVVFLLFVSVLLISLPLYGCTTFVVGKDASKDGSTMTTHTCDCGSCDSRLIYVPAKDHEPGSKRPVYECTHPYPRFVDADRAPGYAPMDGQEPTEPLGYIPEVEHTYSYFDGSYAIMNEHGLGIGETTAAAKVYKQPKPKSEAILHSDVLSRLALERCKTARCAIKTMGKLAVEHGYYGWGENLSIIDGEEAWVFTVVPTPDEPSAVWVAQRVPDDEVAVVPNIITIREIDFDDPDNFMYSDNIKEVAKDQGWWEEGEPFDFLKVHGGGEYGHPYYSLRRKWRGLDKLAPSKNFDPYVEGEYTKQYPFSVKPDEKVSVKDVFELQRDYYQGTQFDLTEGLAAGPFSSPYRWAGGEGEDLVEGAWERPISVFRCSYTFVMQVRNDLPDPVKGVTWWGPDAPHSTVYVPFYAGINKIPEAYSTGHLSEFTRDSAWWAFDFVSNWAHLKFSYMIEDIKEKQEEIESKELAMQPAIDQAAKSLYEQDPELAREFLTDYSVRNANEVVDQWWDFADHLIVKYNDGYVNKPELAKGVGYPAEWLEKVGYDEGPTSYEEPEEE